MDQGGWERHGNTPLQSTAGGLSVLSSPADAAAAMVGGRDEREDELVLNQQSFAMKKPGPTTQSPGPPSPIMSATNVHYKEVKASRYSRAVLTTSSVLVNEPAPTTGRFSLPSKSPRAANHLMSSSAESRGGGGAGGGRSRMLDGRRAADGGGGGKIRLATKRHLTRTMSPQRPAAGDASAALVAKGGPRCWVQQPAVGKPRGSGFRTAHAVSRLNERRDQGVATPGGSTGARPQQWGGAVYNVEEAAAVAAVTVGGMNEEAALATHAPRYHWPVRKIQTAHTSRGRATAGSSPSSVDTRGGGVTSPRSSALAPWGGKSGSGGGAT
jgi:hypothetical protein